MYSNGTGYYSRLGYQRTEGKIYYNLWHGVGSDDMAPVSLQEEELPYNAAIECYDIV